MKLSIKERIVFPTLFPNKSDLITLRLVKDFAKKIELSQDEIKKIGLTVVDGNYGWNNGVKLEIDVKFTELELKMFKDKIKEMDESKTVPLDIIDLIEKILAYEKK